MYKEVRAMAFDKTCMIIDHDLKRLATEETDEMVAHILCYEGKMNFLFDGKPFTLESHCGMITALPRLLEDLNPSPDFKAGCIYVTMPYLEYCSPKNNFGIRGTMSLFENPVMRLNDEQFQQLDADFRNIEHRYNQDSHRFQEDIMYCATQTLFLDYFDPHASELADYSDFISEQNASVITRFLKLLNDGSYIKHRELAWYADKLFVTSKYLSEICKDVSGKAANYWINRFATIHIRKLLRERDMTFTQIADLFEFSSPAYFSRFVQKNLGATPSAFRQ